MKKNILKKSLLVAFGAIALASCTTTNDNALLPDFNDADNSSVIPTVLESQWFKVPNAFYHGKAFPLPTTTASVSSVKLSEAIVVSGVAYANVTIVSNEKLRRIFAGITGLNEYFEIFPLSRAEEYDGMTSSVEYDEATGKWTYIIPIQYVSPTNTDFPIVITAENDDCEIAALTEVEPTPDPEPGPPAPTPGPDPDPVVPTPDDPYIHGNPDDLHIYLTFDEQKDVDLYLVTPGGKEIYWNNMKGDVRPGGYPNPIYTWWMDIDSYHHCNKTDPLMEHLFIPKQIVKSGTYTIRVNLHKHCDAYGKPVNWKVWGTWMKNPLVNILTGKTVTAAEPLTGSYAGNATAYPHAAGAGEVYMKFTITDGPYTGTAMARGQRQFTEQELDEAWENCVEAPKTEGQIIKAMEME